MQGLYPYGHGSVFGEHKTRALACAYAESSASLSRTASHGLTASLLHGCHRSRDVLRADVFAAGDVARFPYNEDGLIRVEHWQVAQQQGRVAAENMLGLQRPYSDVPFFWTVLFGMSLRYAGMWTVVFDYGRNQCCGLVCAGIASQSQLHRNTQKIYFIL